ncbi:MAG: Hsp20/alpha crystallin family protein [Campylobacterales bacterium]
MTLTHTLKNWEHRLEDSLKSGWQQIKRPALALFGHTPPANTDQDSDSFTIRVDLPGVEKRDLFLSVEGGHLVLRAQRRYENEKEEAGYYHKESYFGALERVFALPDEVDAEKIDARLENGVLTIKAPFSPDKLPRKISIR